MYLGCGIFILGRRLTGVSSQVMLSELFDPPIQKLPLSCLDLMQIETHDFRENVMCFLMKAKREWWQTISLLDGKTHASEFVANENIEPIE